MDKWKKKREQRVKQTRGTERDEAVVWLVVLVTALVESTDEFKLNSRWLCFQKAKIWHLWSWNCIYAGYYTWVWSGLHTDSLILLLIDSLQSEIEIITNQNTNTTINFWHAAHLGYLQLPRMQVHLELRPGGAHRGLEPPAAAAPAVRTRGVERPHVHCEKMKHEYKNMSSISAVPK